MGDTELGGSVGTWIWDKATQRWRSGGNRC
jgi:hypothetical protein